jgi:hypothetical protein
MEKQFFIGTKKEDKIIVALYISAQGKHSSRVPFVTAYHFVQRQKWEEASTKTD